jgi:tetratricopeptide (TPR) repeat protein
MTGLLAAGLLSLWCGVAGAQAVELRAQAGALVEQGRQAQRDGRFDEAIRLYQEAYELAPHPAIFYNLGQAHRLKGDSQTALYYYRKYLLADAQGQVSKEAKILVELLDRSLVDEEVRRLEEAEQQRLEQVREEEETRRLAALLAERALPRRAGEARLPPHDQGVLDDASATTVFLMPTGLTPPAGAWSLHDHGVLVVGASYSLTDRLQLSASLAPSTLGRGFMGLAAGKVQAWRGGAWRVAGQAAAFGNAAGAPSFAGVLGVVTTLCLEIGRAHV